MCGSWLSILFPILVTSYHPALSRNRNPAERAYGLSVEPLPWYLHAPRPVLMLVLFDTPRMGLFPSLIPNLNNTMLGKTQ